MDASDQDLYSDAPEEGSAEPQEARQQASDAPTALLPKSAFGGSPPQPGDMISCRVTRVMDKEVEVQISGGKGEPDSDDMMM